MVCEGFRVKQSEFKRNLSKINKIEWNKLNSLITSLHIFAMFIQEKQQIYSINYLLLEGLFTYDDPSEVELKLEVFNL